MDTRPGIAGSVRHPSIRPHLVAPRSRRAPAHFPMGASRIHGFNSPLADPWYHRVAVGVKHSEDRVSRGSQPD